MRPTSGAATASLVLGILGILCLGLPAIPAVICGHLALREIRAGARGGHGRAVAGLVLGYIVIAVWLFAGIAAAVSH
jgi:hypothetical protein